MVTHIAAGNHFTLLFVKQDLHHLDSSLGNRCTRTEDGCYACLVEEVVVLGRNHTTGDDHNVLATQFLQFLDQLRDERLVASCQ